ncbi:MAG: ROK family protein [Rhodocyclaceae bacterium]|nr:ROK family protein [Rhodocyclaceae bacterium]
MPELPCLRLGVDLGGTKIELLALGAGGQERWRRRVSAPRHDYRQALDAIVALVSECESELGARGTLGVGIPGSVRHDGRVKNAFSTPLVGHALARDLAERLQREVRVANDADCFALSEAVDGAAAGAGVVFGVILGTGVGGGLVVHGRLVDGANAIAGEWGHNPLPWPRGDELPGPSCSCGRPGHIESWLSGPGFARAYAMAGGEPLAPAAIVARMRTGEPLARRCFDDYADRLARALATAVNFLDPHVIVLGGGMSNVAEIYREVPRRWRDHIHSDELATRLECHRHGDASGVRGAAWLGGGPG